MEIPDVVPNLLFFGIVHRSNSSVLFYDLFYDFFDICSIFPDILVV